MRRPVIELHPQVLEKDGKKQFVVLPYTEFVRLQEELADYDDLQTLRAAKQAEGDAETRTLEEVRQALADS